MRALDRTARGRLRLFGCVLLAVLTAPNVRAEAVGVADWQATVFGHLGQGVAVDATNNAYLVSTAIGVVRLDRCGPDGVPQWSRSLFSGATGSIAGVVVDGAGNALVYGTALGKYTPAGTLVWSRILPGATVGAQAWSGVTDSSGDLFVAASDSFTARLVVSRLSGATGQTVWTTTLPDPSLYFARIVRAGDQVLVSAGNDLQLLVTSFDAATGAQLAFRNETTAGAFSDIAIGPAGEVAVVGGGTFLSPATTFTLFEYDATLSTVLLARSYPDGVSARGVAIDAQRNLYVTGIALEPNPATVVGPDGTITQGPYGDWSTMKLDPTGSPLWRARFSQRNDTSEVPVALHLARDGSLYVTGIAGNPTGATASRQATTVQYSAGGALLWRAAAPPSVNGVDVKQGSDGSVFAAAGSPQSSLVHYPALPKPNALTLSRTSVGGGGRVTATVRVTRASGVVVALASSNPAVASVPATVTVPAGSTTATFTVSTSRVRSNTVVGIAASANGGTVSTTLTVRR